MAANNPQDKSGWKMVPYPQCNQEEASGSIETSNEPIAAEPISCWKPDDYVADAATEMLQAADGTMRKKRKYKSSEFLEEIEKDFSLYEVFKVNNIQEINQDKDDRTLDQEELMKYLTGWRIEKRKRQNANGSYRVDSIYRHPKIRKALRSVVEVKKFIEENSYVRKTSKNGEGASQGPVN